MNREVKMQWEVKYPEIVTARDTYEKKCPVTPASQETFYRVETIDRRFLEMVPRQFFDLSSDRPGGWRQWVYLFDEYCEIVGQVTFSEERVDTGPIGMDPTYSAGETVAKAIARMAPELPTRIVEVNLEYCDDDIFRTRLDVIVWNISDPAELRRMLVRAGALAS